MPSVRPGLVVQVPATSFALGKSDTGDRRLAYTTSPIFDGSYSTDAAVLAAFKAPRELSSGQINDGGYAFGLVDRFYQGAPDLATVVVGGGGLPGSPYAPNLGVPGEGHGQNPAAIPASGVTLTQNQRSRSNGAFIGNGLVSPSSTVAGVLDGAAGGGLGIGSGNSFRVRI